MYGLGVMLDIARLKVQLTFQIFLLYGKQDLIQYIVVLYRVGTPATQL